MSEGRLTDHAWIVALDTYLCPEDVHNVMSVLLEDDEKCEADSFMNVVRNDQWHKAVGECVEEECAKSIFQCFFHFARRYGVTSDLTTGRIPQLQEPTG